MVRRIAWWGLCGAAVALAWALVFYLLGPEYGHYRSQGAVLHALGRSPVVPITAPVALLGRRYAISWYWSAAINAAMYACVGMAVETIRIALHLRTAPVRR